MRVWRRTRTGVGFMLGVLVGLGLVTIPGVLAPPTQTSTASDSNSRVTSFQYGQPGSLGNQTTSASSGVTAGSLLILVSLVMIPAIALSFLARYWTLKQAKDRLGLKN